MVLLPTTQLLDFIEEPFQVRFHVLLVLDWHSFTVSFVAFVNPVGVVVSEDGGPIRVDELERVLDSDCMDFAFWNASDADFDEATVSKLEAWIVFYIHAFSSITFVQRATDSDMAA